jgi:hypothetical protein
MIHSFMLGILIVFFLLVFCPLFLGMIFLDNLFACFFYLIIGEPLIISAIQRFIMNVILITILSLGLCGVITYINHSK